MTAPAARHDNHRLTELHELRVDSKRARSAFIAERLALCELLSDGPELSAGEHSGARIVSRRAGDGQVFGGERIMTTWVCDCGNVAEWSDDTGQVFCTPCDGKEMHRYAMTPETKAFFAREDVRAFVERVRAWFPGASFGALRAAGELDRDVLVWLGDRGLIADTGVDREFLADFIGESPSFVSWVDAGERLRAVSEGRALIEDSGSDEAGGSTREDELANGPASAEALQTPAPSRPVCDVCNEPVSSHAPCSVCKQTVWNCAKPGLGKYCGDCYAARFRGKHDLGDLDTRIAAARKADPDPTDEWRAWATPSAEGVEW